MLKQAVENELEPRISLSTGHSRESGNLDTEDILIVFKYLYMARNIDLDSRFRGNDDLFY
jgi:hypothetical protein